MFLFDAHLDLSMNAVEWNRDLTQDLYSIREREKHLTDKPDRGKGVVSFPEMRKGNIGLCVATQIGRYIKPDSKIPGWHSQAQAWAITQAQVAWYKAMEEAGEMVQITGLAGLREHLHLWQNAESTEGLPIGYILSLEGADSFVSLRNLETAYGYGLRAIGPAHYGPGVYAYGTDSDAPLTGTGKDLLREMDQLDMILDATHLCDTAFWEAMDLYRGPVWASHNLVRAVTPHNRQFSDDMVKVLLDRGAVIGMAFDAWMMIPGWVRGKSTPENTGLKIEHIVQHIDHICQIAGNAQHVGIGSDLDGAYGKEQSPGDLDSIADLQTIPALLAQRGYSESDIERIMWRNWVDFLEKNWA
ncbi:dipeptidase [Dyadobacter fermentans]|uniref:Peptidase M19 renal dipeptidase n=1 Tax=Dyadobacter fermentans (strain ATCC 700827 / DSM 18053 / CIP 107007 / KCTC 52180 / NS114) TaxID=471854 RepID=C6W437_DYAFD|nr:membrane dipeptidase [Dyadobacter fermentans]ACT92274.1 peptidase M19 renal dipeptidase [Dyadobacter fermentans DSM 18053]